MSDVAEGVINHVFHFMQIDEEWSIREERGFVWWSGPIAQRIWADATYRDGEVDITRVHCRTDLVRGYDGSSEQAEWLSDVLRLTSVSAPIRTEGGDLQLTASLNIHDEVKDWLEDLLSWVAVLQLYEATKALMLGGQRGLAMSAAASAHPRSGLREEPDDLLNTVERVVRPSGQGPSRWLSEDFEGIAKHLMQPPIVLVNGDETGIAIELPFPRQTSLLRALADQPHPDLGSGCLFLVSLPEVTGAASSLERALELNGQIHNGRADFTALGSWCPTEEGLAHCTFLPSAMHRDGALFSHLMYEIGRLRWLTEGVLQFSIADHFEERFREKMTSLGVNLE